jgi:hypothetical protein
MYKILAGAAALGLLALPILASAQSTSPTTKNETAATPGTPAKKSAVANTTKKATNKGSMKRQAQVTKKRRVAMHGHNIRHATAKHGKRFAKAHSRHRHGYGVSTAKRMPQASAKAARGAVSDRPTSMQRRAAYRAESVTGQRSCGEFMYRKDGKCNDARNKPPAK